MPKRTRATKLTDVRAEKAWLKKTKPSGYVLETRDKQKTYLIVCEGQTEEQYFKAFPVVTASVKPVPLGCTKTNLVECTKHICSNEAYDEVWCVFDMDFNPDIRGQFNDFNEAISAAHLAGFKCAYSNDAFELWFALHYNFYDQQHDRFFYYEKLSQFWQMNYEKSGKELAFSRTIYARLNNDVAADQTMALKWAEKLWDEQQHKSFHEQNPITLVYRLVNELNKHLRK